MSSEPTRCSSCGAWVFFARHDRTGKAAPLEPDPAGRFTIVNGVYFLAAPNVHAMHRYSSHFATCSGAARHRKTASA